MDRPYPHEVDVAIVGSGPAGAAYARILSEIRPDLSIAVFEVGPVISDPPGTHVKNIGDPRARATAQRASQGPYADRTPSDPEADVYTAGRRARPGTFLLTDGYQQAGEDGLPAAAMSSNVGGMAAHWTGACPRPGDEEYIDFVPDLDELLTQAERLLNVTAHAFDDAPLSALVRGRLADAVDKGRRPDRRVQAMPLAVERHADGRVTWSGSATVFGDASRDNPLFSLVAETLVSRVLIKNGRVDGVAVRDQRNGDEHEVRAPIVVVAADSLRTPQVLWASGVRLEAVGRYLNDQPQLVYAVRLSDLPVRVEAQPTSNVDESGLSRNSGVNWVPYTSDHPFHGQVMQLDASPVRLADEDEPAPGSIVGLGWFCAKDLQASDRVSFSEDRTDAYGMPAMQIHYTLTERDHQSIAAAGEAVRQAGAAVGTPYSDEPLLLAPGSSLHYQGSVRMGPVDDGTSVCGPTSQVWGVDGLYVAGNGVIPTPMACNPTLTAVALAVGGARHIADRLESRTDRPAVAANH